jgi:glycoside/pentoside/hexuronide:cation symporter, GPH family
VAEPASGGLRVEKLPLRVKFAWATSGVQLGARIYLMGLLLFYYNQIVGLRAELVGTALSISLLIDAFWDPMIGHVSDNLRTRLGRRHTMMYASIIPFFIFFVLLFRPPAGLTDWQTFWWMLVTLLGTRFSVSLFEVPTSALAPELAPDYHDRTVMMGVRFALLYGGGAVASMIGYFGFFRPTPDYPRGQLNPEAWPPLTLAVAAMMLTAMVIVTVGTHHRIKRLHVPPPRKLNLRATLKDLGATLKNFNLLVVVVAAMISGMASGLYSGLALYIATYFWALPAASVGVLEIARLVGAVIAAFIAPPLSRRFGKKWTCMLLFFGSVAANAIPLIMGLMGTTPPRGSGELLLFLTAFRFTSDILSAGGFMIVTSMIADVTDDAVAKTGRRAEGLLMSADSFLQQVTTAMSALLPAFILAAVNFPEKPAPGVVTDEMARSLVLVYLPATVAISSLSIATWTFFRIDQKKHEQNLLDAQEAMARVEAALEAGEPPSITTPVGGRPI